MRLEFLKSRDLVAGRVPPVLGGRRLSREVISKVN